MLEDLEQGVAARCSQSAGLVAAHEVLGLQAAGVDGGDHDRVGHDGAKRLQVEGEGGAPGAGFVEEAGLLAGMGSKPTFSKAAVHSLTRA